MWLVEKFLFLQTSRLRKVPVKKTFLWALPSWNERTKQSKFIIMNHDHEWLWNHSNASRIHGTIHGKFRRFMLSFSLGFIMHLQRREQQVGTLSRLFSQTKLDEWPERTSPWTTLNFIVEIVEVIGDLNFAVQSGQIINFGQKLANFVSEKSSFWMYKVCTTNRVTLLL